MKNILYIILVGMIAGVLTYSCSPIKYVPIEHEKETNIKDSIIYNIRDSITVIPVERIVDIVPQYDTLTLETSLAKAKAYVDTTLHVLKGNIENKETFTQHTQKEEKEKIKVKYIFEEKPIPYKVEVTTVKHPSYEKWLWLIIVASLAYFGIKLKKKFKIF